MNLESRADLLELMKELLHTKVSAMEGRGFVRNNSNEEREIFFFPGKTNLRASNRNKGSIFSLGKCKETTTTF